MGKKKIPEQEYKYVQNMVQQQIRSSGINTKTTDKRANSSFEQWLRRQIREILHGIGKPVTYINAIIDELQKMVEDSLGIKRNG
jgi:hypothetical protein